MNWQFRNGWMIPTFKSPQYGNHHPIMAQGAKKKNKTKWKPCPGMWLLTLPIPAFQILKGNVFSCIPNTYGRATRMSYQIPALSRLFRGDRLVVTHSAVICHFYSPLSWCVRTNTSELASLQAIRKMDSAVEEYRIGYQMTWILVQGL